MSLMRIPFHGGPADGHWLETEAIPDEERRPDPVASGTWTIYRPQRVDGGFVFMPVASVSDRHFAVEVDGTTYLCRVRADLTPANAFWECLDERSGNHVPLGVEARFDDLGSPQREEQTRASLRHAIRERLGSPAGGTP